MINIQWTKIEQKSIGSFISGNDLKLGFTKPLKMFSLKLKTFSYKRFQILFKTFSAFNGRDKAIFVTMVLTDSIIKPPRCSVMIRVFASLDPDI